MTVARLLPFLLLACGPASAAPLGYLEGFGPRARPVVDLTWGLMALSVGVVIIISALVLVGVLMRGRSLRPGEAAPASVTRAGGQKGISWIYFGLALTVIALGAFGAWTMTTLASIRLPGAAPEVRIEVTAHQWWWEVRYQENGEARAFTTANEIHIPVGEPVEVTLVSEDVIHSFWVPALAGKTDLIPGQINRTWLEADTPGVYRGQCAEYCGLQHAHMGFRVVGQPRREFDEWREHQLRPAPEPETEAQQMAENAFVMNCGACHAVRGTIARGALGPDLSHLMGRETLASGMLANTVPNLSGWIADPQHLKPGTTMPNPDLSGRQLHAIREFLLTLE